MKPILDFMSDACTAGGLILLLVIYLRWRFGRPYISPSMPSSQPTTQGSPVKLSQREQWVEYYGAMPEESFHIAYVDEKPANGKGRPVFNEDGKGNLVLQYQIYGTVYSTRDGPSVTVWDDQFSDGS